jgi:hypothetical protein
MVMCFLTNSPGLPHLKNEMTGWKGSTVPLFMMITSVQIIFEW